MAFDLNSVNSTLTQASDATEAALEAKMPASGEDLDQADLIALQYEFSKWQMMTSLQSNIMKTMTDSMKNTISNMR